jgi:hypothetical protein
VVWAGRTALPIVFNTILGSFEENILFSQNGPGGFPMLGSLRFEIFLFFSEKAIWPQMKTDELGSERLALLVMPHCGPSQAGW